jgi:hypothetical protein
MPIRKLVLFNPYSTSREKEKAQSIISKIETTGELMPYIPLYWKQVNSSLTVYNSSLAC